MRFRRLIAEFDCRSGRVRRGVVANSHHCSYFIHIRKLCVLGVTKCATSESAIFVRTTLNTISVRTALRTVSVRIGVCIRQILDSQAGSLEYHEYPPILRIALRFCFFV
jgi:hypothetical protein